MLIVCTQDQAVREAAEDPGKGGGAWAPIHLMPPGGQPAATVNFRARLAELGENDPLCLSAHGNNNEIGDAGVQGWGWSDREIAELLRDNVVATWKGPILIHACADAIVNFSANLAVRLGGMGVFNGVWCYGYNRAVPSGQGFPAPGTLAAQADLQGTQV